MTVQYREQASALIGGAGSGSLNIGAKGPTKTILTGYIMLAKVCFHVIGEFMPANQSPFTGFRIKLVMPTKANAETRKIITNFLNDIFILSALFLFWFCRRAGLKIFIVKPSNSRAFNSPVVCCRKNYYSFLV